jgi:hypothetical protein
MKRSRIALLVLALSFALGAQPSFSASDEYDDSQSHPLRVLAYLVHPAAFLVEWTVFRPFHFLVSATEAQEALFGHTPHPQVLSHPVTPRDVPSAQPKQVSVSSQRADQSEVVNAGPDYSLQEDVRVAERP